jgi:hypothetical protein
LYLYILKTETMKQILLIISFLLIQITGYPQEFLGNSPGWSNNSTIETEKNQSESKIYPNPCKDKKITIELNADLLSEIRLINITGKEVFIKRLEIPVNRQQFEFINVPNGIYMVHLKTVDNKIIVKKLLITGY